MCPNKLTPREHSDLQRWPNANEIKLVHSCTGFSNGPAFIRTAASHKLMLSALQRLPVRGRSHHLVMGGAKTPRHHHASAILTVRLQLSYLLCIVSRSAVKPGSTKECKRCLFWLRARSFRTCAQHSAGGEKTDQRKIRAAVVPSIMRRAGCGWS